MDETINTAVYGKCLSITKSNQNDIVLSFSVVIIEIDFSIYPYKYRMVP